MPTERTTGDSQSLPRTDREILDFIQASFPVEHAPYDRIARLVGRQETGGQVHARIRHLFESGVIRRLGAVFDTKGLGFVSTLVGMRVPPPRIDEVAAIVSSYDGVSHNYGRDGDYNLWFTLAAPDEAGMTRTLEDIRERTGCRNCASLPVVKVHKIQVHFDLGTTAGTIAASPRPPRPVDLNDTDRQVVRELQGTLPLDTLHPYEEISTRCGIAESHLLATISRWVECGLIRRVGAILRHQRVGMVANAMSVWRIADASALQRTAAELSKLKQVTHCYERLPHPDWPYNLYAMIHGTSRHECEQTASEVARRTGCLDYALLFSVKEYKKESLAYF